MINKRTDYKTYNTIYPQKLLVFKNKKLPTKSKHNSKSWLAKLGLSAFKLVQYWFKYTWLKLKQFPKLPDNIQFGINIHKLYNDSEFNQKMCFYVIIIFYVYLRTSRHSKNLRTMELDWARWLNKMYKK